MAINKLELVGFRHSFANPMLRIAHFAQNACCIACQKNFTKWPCSRLVPNEQMSPS